MEQILKIEQKTLFSPLNDGMLTTVIYVIVGAGLLLLLLLLNANPS